MNKNTQNLLMLVVLVETLMIGVLACMTNGFTTSMFTSVSRDKFARGRGGSGTKRGKCKKKCRGTAKRCRKKCSSVACRTACNETRTTCVSEC